MSSTINAANFSDGTSTYVLTSNGPGTNPTFQAVSAAGALTGITAGTNISVTGSAPSPTVNVVNSPSFSGSVTAGTGLTVTTGNAVISSGNLRLPTTTSSVGQIVQNGVIFIHTYGSDNLFIGTPAAQAGNFTLTGTDNVAIGANVMKNLTSGSLNFGIGTNSLNAVTQGQNNVAYGIACIQGVTTGNQNIAIGNNSVRYTTAGNNIGIGYQAYQGANGTTTGHDNIIIGTQAGSAYTSSESSNIIIGSSLAGTASESSVIRIGNGQTSCYIAGIDGVNVGSTAKVVTESSNQLGTATITAGTGITITPTANTITIATSGTSTGNSILSTTQSMTSLTNGTTQYYQVTGTRSTSVYSSSFDMIVPYSGTLSNLYINIETNAAVNTGTITLYINGVSTALSASITALTTGVFSDTTHSVSVTAGQGITLAVAPTTTGSWTSHSATMVFTA